MVGLFLTRTITVILICLMGFLGYQGYIYYTINQKNTVNAQNIKVELPAFYNIGINDTMLTAYLLKIGYFQFDKNLTYDGVFNKNWLPLSYNFCNSKMWSNIYTINDDFDKDGLAGINDKFPFDYSNGDASIRNSDSLDFDKDSIPNKLDMDADGNGVPDIYQSLCFDWVNDKSKEQRKWFWGNDWNKLLSNPDEYKWKIKELLMVKIPNGEIKDMDAFEQGINIVYNKLLYNEDVIYSIDGKNYYIARTDILSNSDVDTTKTSK